MRSRRALQFFASAVGDQPIDIAARAIDHAKRHYFDVLIVDTAGRLAIDEAMMQEVAALEARLNPIETLFVVDAMLGQDAVDTAKVFADRLPLTGVILTKLDGDSRGGAALSVRHVTGKPIKFVGVGEKLDGLELFSPDRMASRILGMGDIVSLVEDVKKSVDQESAQKFAKRMQSGERFDLNDFKEQIVQMRKMGGLSEHARQAAGAARGSGRSSERGCAGKTDPPHRRHHQFDDRRRARKTRVDQSLTQAPHRSRSRCSGAGSQSNAEAVRSDAG